MISWKIMLMRRHINRVIIAGIVVVVAVGAIFGTRFRLLPQEARSAFSWVTGLNYVPVSVLGDVVFRVPNRDLAFPWSRGDHPASTMCRFSPKYHHDNEALCAELAVQGSLSMVLRVTLRDTTNKVASWTSFVTVHYGSSTKFPPHLLAHLASWRRGRVPINREPRYDVGDFAAFRLLPRPGMPPNRLFDNFIHVLMVRTGQADPQSAVCDTSSSDPDLKNASCQTWVGFLVQAYPQNTDMSYRYWLGFTLPIRLLSRSDLAAKIVTAQVCKFIS